MKTNEEPLLLLGPMKPVLSELVQPEWFEELAKALLGKAHRTRITCRETIQHHPYFICDPHTFADVFLGQLIHHLQRNNPEGVQSTINYLSTLIRSNHVVVTKHPDNLPDPGSEDDHH